MEEEKKENSSENKLEVPTKNPWWVKAVPHSYIIILFLNVITTRSIWDILEILIWIYFGIRIQSDKFIIAKSFRLYLVLLLGVMCISFFGNISKLVKIMITQF